MSNEKVFKRFLKYVDIGKLNECWLWHGSTHKFGYGQFKWPARRIHNAHVASYELFVGSRNGLSVCHSCDNPLCVNPNHLWLGTQKQNVEDMDIKGRARRYDLSSRDQRGEKNCKAKLTSIKVKELRELYATGKYSYSQIANKSGVSVMTVYRAIVGQNWGHVGGSVQ